MPGASSAIRKNGRSAPVGGWGRPNPQGNYSHQNSQRLRVSGRRPDPSGLPPTFAFRFALPGGKMPQALRIDSLYPNNPQAVTETD